jgi:hypothetical protein
MRTLDLHRGLVTLLGAAIAGFLLWVATQVGQQTTGRFWAAMGIVAGAGLVMAASQLAGGWTKFGRPRLSLGVFLLGFLPVLVCTGWVLLATQPGNGWQEGRLVSWSHSLGIFGGVHALGLWHGVFAFGFGLVFGYCFDTTGPVVAEDTLVARRRRRVAPGPAPAPVPTDDALVDERAAADEPLTAEREAAHDAQPHTVTVGPHDAVGSGTRSAVGDGRRVEIREGD